MARKKKSRIAELLKSAQKTLAQEILASTMQQLPGRTTMGEVVSSLEAAGFGKDFEAMSLEDFASALGGPAPAKATGSRRKAKKKATRARRPAKVNTRTEEGRAALDAAVGKTLASANGPSKAESIRAAVGGTAAQVRQSLSRLIEEKKVTKSGQKRGTAYSLRGKAGGKAEAASKPRGRK